VFQPGFGIHFYKASFLSYRKDWILLLNQLLGFTTNGFPPGILYLKDAQPKTSICGANFHQVVTGRVLQVAVLPAGSPPVFPVKCIKGI
jgi:hypothetical protein